MVRTVFTLATIWSMAEPENVRVPFASVMTGITTFNGALIDRRLLLECLSAQTFKAVIPAKIGIHRHHCAWIPAFAGMTAQRY
jgi:hypothetical protein